MKFLVTLAITFFTITVSAQTEWISYTDSTFNFTVQRPADWQFKLPGTDTRFFITSYKESETDNFRENINCIAKKLSATIPIKAAESEIIKSLSSKVDNFHLVRSGYYKWNNSDAFEIEFTGTYNISSDKTLKVHLLQRAAIIDDILYTLTYTSEADSYDKYIGIVKEVIRTFKIN